MKNLYRYFGLPALALLVVAGGIALAQNVSNYMEQGGSRWVIGGSLDIVGGDLDVESGATFKIAGATMSSTAAELNLLDNVTVSSGDIEATLNFEDTISSSATVLTVTDGTIDFNIASHDGSNGLKLGGTLVTATAADLNLLDGVTATTAELDQSYLTVFFEDIDSGSSVAYVPIPVAGDISNIRMAVKNALLVGNVPILTMSITNATGTTAITTGTVTVSSPVFAGETGSTTPSALNTVAVGDAIKIVSDGGPTTTSDAVVTFTIDR